MTPVGRRGRRRAKPVRRQHDLHSDAPVKRTRPTNDDSEYVRMLLRSIRAKLVCAATSCGVDEATARRICDALDLTVEGLPTHVRK